MNYIAKYHIGCIFGIFNRINWVEMVTSILFLFNAFQESFRRNTSISRIIQKNIHLKRFSNMRCFRITLVFLGGREKKKGEKLKSKQIMTKMWRSLQSKKKSIQAWISGSRWRAKNLCVASNTRVQFYLLFKKKKHWKKHEGEKLKNLPNKQASNYFSWFIKRNMVKQKHWTEPKSVDSPTASKCIKNKRV